MSASLRTPRLHLRPFADADLPALYAFMSNASAMQYTYVAPSPQACHARLSAYEAMRSTLGFAPWVVTEAEQTEPIGWGGLSIDPEEPEWGLEVSYAFAPSTWGRGFATELVSASLAYAFGPLQAREVSAFAKPENVASTKVLSKCGFQRLRFEPKLQRNHFLARVPGEA